MALLLKLASLAWARKMTVSVEEPTGPNALIAGHFDAGVGVIAGSALFNILVIPALVGLAVGGVTVRSVVIKRDGLLYVAVVIAFILVFYFSAAGEVEGTRVLSPWAGAAAILLYVVYVLVLFFQARKKPQGDAEGTDAATNATGDSEEAGDEAEDAAPKEGDEAEDQKDSIAGSVLRIVVGMAGVGVACHFLVEYGLELVKIIGFSPAVAGVTVLAAATSLPDTLLSVFAARRGDADGAIANAFASNTFDILICLGLPILVTGGLAMNWDEGWPILICLLISTFTAVLLMITDWKITRSESVFKLMLYFTFCAAIFLGWL